MLSTTEFDEWAENLGLSEEAKKEIECIRNSPPSRRVGGGKRNVSGKFSSKKMGVTIQFESHKVEYPFLFTLEYDENVLEFYDQPPSLKFEYVGSKGKKGAYFYTPDFFVIEKDKAYWVECKTEETLVKLSQEKSDKYYIENEEWVFVPLKQYSSQYDLGSRVFSSSDINWNLQRNLMYLKDYIDGECVVDKGIFLKIKSKILSNPNVTLLELYKAFEEGHFVDAINSLIATRMIYVDLHNSLLVEPEKVKVYLNEEQSKSIASIKERPAKTKIINKINLKTGSKFIWGDKLCTIKNCTKDTIFLVNEGNEFTELPLQVFNDYVKKGYIKGFESEDGNFEDNSIIEIMEANEEDLKIANYRYEVVTRYLKDNTINVNVTDRTVRNWVKQYQDAEELYGHGFIGLLPKNKKKGNRNSKLPEEIIDLMDQLLEKSYETIKNKSLRVVYGELLNICKEENLTSPSYQTFCARAKNRSVYNTKQKREGSRAAYKYEEFYWELEFTTPRHGDRVFEIAHIDHTELDIEIDINGKDSVRPWITFMIDAFSRRILAFYLSFESPSYRSCMMIIRECVKNHNRLPNCIVLDGGKEFNSVYFESLLARYSVDKKERPAAKARYGNIVERMFGISNEFLIHNLIGNTQLTKNVRQVTKSVNPKNHAVWSLSELNEMMESWIDDVYDNIQNPSLGTSAKEAFEESILATGLRSHTLIPYDENFILMTLPEPKGKTRKVQPGAGIKLNNIYYWTDLFRDPSIEGSGVEVRYDPFDISIAYVFLNNKWEKCKSEYFTLFSGRTEKEIKLITEQIKEKQRNNSRYSKITAQTVAHFIQKVEVIEERKISERYEQEKELRKQQFTVVGNNDKDKVKKTSLVAESAKEIDKEEEFEDYGDLRELEI